MTTTAPAISASFLAGKHQAALSYEDYLATDPGKAPAWRQIGAKTVLTPAQQRLLGGFTRDMKVICLSGIWCGDCVQQGPLLERIAEASSRIDLGWLDRDEHMDLTRLVRINAGDRVPVVIFMAEDFEPVAIYGDRTLTRYRALAARNLGPSCPVPGAPVPPEELAATLQDWLDEFERVQLLLRLSTRLRAKHGD
ncbi:MAG: thioredoxin family protein [Phycisphaerales bacterium]|nr:thioredoxin family protein [Phycisphaerales bacterium]